MPGLPPDGVQAAAQVTNRIGFPVTEAQPAIEVDDLRKTYVTRRGTLRRVRTENRALAGVSFSIGRGELFGLLGPNGAGKTTATKILTTLLVPDSGRAWVLGLDVVRHTNELRRRIGFVFGGERGLYWRLSGLDNLRYFADLYRIPPSVSHRRIAELLDRLGLAGREHDKVEHYSRGMKQRLHLARGLLNDPEVLFLDEPTIGLDPVGARELRALFRGLADAGKTIFLTTHYMFEADAICDRIAVIKNGVIVAAGTPGSIKKLVEDLGVVEFEAAGITPDRLQALRSIPDVSSVTVLDRDLAQFVTIRCAHPADVMTRLGVLLDGVTVVRPTLRDPTLEDAYVQLIGDSSD
jgi:ABC-2 type transport system ATP-binding protein